MQSRVGFEGFAVGSENPGLVGSGGVFPLVVNRSGVLHLIDGGDDAGRREAEGTLEAVEVFALGGEFAFYEFEFRLNGFGVSFGLSPARVVPAVDQVQDSGSIYDQWKNSTGADKTRIFRANRKALEAHSRLHGV